MIKGAHVLKTFIMLMVSSVLIISCNKEESLESNKLPVILTIRPIAFGFPVDTTVYYKNGSGESFKISKFSFYISQPELVKRTGEPSTENRNYHLIDLYDLASQTFSTDMKKGVYDSIRFTIGVDSTHNVSGAQTGALDPVNGMFWTWNTGYIFAKLEGRSPESTAPNQRITYHIGGFKTGENAIRTISIPLSIDVEKTAEIMLSADLSYWFDGKEQIQIAKHPSIMSPGPVAVKFADNYAQMFTINKIINR